MITDGDRVDDSGDDGEAGDNLGEGDSERLNEAGPAVEVEASCKKCCAGVEKGLMTRFL